VYLSKKKKRPDEYSSGHFLACGDFGLISVQRRCR
jgi:hypothetical protein